jgi:hypothetical protein
MKREPTWLDTICVEFKMPSIPKGAFETQGDLSWTWMAMTSLQAHRIQGHRKVPLVIVGTWSPTADRTIRAL